MRRGILIFLLCVCEWALAKGEFGDHIFDPPPVRTGETVFPILGAADSPRKILLSNFAKPNYLVFGYAGNGTDTSIAAAQLNPLGHLDTTFNTDGIATFDLTGGEDMIHAVTILGYIAGRAVNGSSVVSPMVGRMTTLGSLNTSFYTVGWRVDPTTGAGEIYRGVVESPGSGKVYATGYSSFEARFGFLIAAYLTDGNLDTSFHTDGKRRHHVSADNNGALAATFTGGNQIMSAGPAYNVDWDFAIVRYNLLGDLDTTFHTDGLNQIPVLSADDKNYGLALTTTSQHVLAGYAYNGANNDIAVVKLIATGSLDTSFSTDGKTTQAIGSGDDVAFGVYEDICMPNRYYVTGSTDNGSNLDVAVLSYRSNGTLDTSFHTDGINTYDIKGSHDVGTSIGMSTGGTAVGVANNQCTIHISARVRNGATDDFALLKIHDDGLLSVSGEGHRSFGTNGVVVSDVSGVDQLLGVTFTKHGNSADAWKGFYGAGVSGGDAVIAKYSFSSKGLNTAFQTDGVVNFDLGGSEVFYTADSIQGAPFSIIGAGEDGADFLLGRVDGNGVIETSFHTDGKLSLDFSGSDRAYGLISVNTPYMVAGRDGSATSNFAVASLLTDGSLDTAFYTTGKRIFSPTGTAAVAKAVTTGGYLWGENANDIVATKLKADGTFDTAFQTDGVATYDFGGTDTLTVADAIGVSRIFIAGGNGTDWIVAKLTSGGVFDTTFSTDGQITIDVAGAGEKAYGLKYSIYGQVLYVSGDDGADFVVKRYKSDGVLDTSFSTDGSSTLNGAGVDANLGGINLNNLANPCLVGTSNGGVDFGAVCIDP